MSFVILNVDEVKRTLSASGGAFVVHDKEVDIVRFAINSGFADIVLDGQVALRVMYQRPGETEVRAKTLTYYDTDGLHNYYDWQLAQSDLAKNGSLMVALCILDISGGEVSEWHTTPCAVRVLSTIHTDDSDEGDAEVTPTVKERVAVLETMIQRVASGAPIVVASTSAMTDTSQIYVLSTDGNWYYHNGTAWTVGGEYGGVANGSVTTEKLANKAVTTAKLADGAVTAEKIASGVIPAVDATLTQTGAAADARVVGSAIRFEFSADCFAQGGIGSNGEDNPGRNTSIFTKEYMTVSDVTALLCKDGSLAYVCLYDDDKASLGRRAVTDNIVFLEDLPNYDKATFFRAELANTELSDYEKLKYIRKISDMDGRIDSVAEEIKALNMEFPVKIYNGTLANPLNKTCVYTDYIPLKGKFVKLLIDRPADEGYYYRYGYRVYNDQKQEIAAYDRVYSSERKDAFVSETEAAYIAFSIDEFDGENVRTLRRTDFDEYTPKVFFHNNVKYADKTIVSKSPSKVVKKYPNDDTNKMISGNTCAVGFHCVENAKYEITKTVGNRFQVLFFHSSEEDTFFDSIVFPNGLSYAEITTPQDAWYMMVYISNSIISDEVAVEGVKIHFTDFVDHTSRIDIHNTNKSLSTLRFDVNNADIWMIGGIGSNGYDFNTRRWGIRTRQYLRVLRNTVIDISEGYQIRLAQYGNDDKFIKRTVYKAGVVALSDVLTEPTNKIRIEINLVDAQGSEIETPFEDTSAYTGIKILSITDLSSEEKENSFRDIYLDLISQSRYIYTSSDSGISPYSCLTLLHCTDLHGNGAGMEYVLNTYKKYENKIDAILHTGDVVTANLSDGIANWVNTGCAQVVLNTIGNHDTEENLVLQAAGKDNVYNTLFAPYISGWDVVQPTGVNDPSSADYHALYYYKDFSASGVRLIVLDTNFWDVAEKEWLTGVLNDALTNTLCVVIACHDVKKLTEMNNSNFSAYSGDGINESTNGYGNQPDDWLDPVKDFMDAGGNFACILAGHNHSGHMGTMTHYPDIFVYVADKSSMNRVSGTARIKGELNQNTVSIVTINPVEKLFKIVKIGAEVDGKMRGKHVFSYDYANKRIISQW